jgi:hypothetical protein
LQTIAPELRHQNNLTFWSYPTNQDKLINRDYAAALATLSKNGFWGPLCFGENLPTVPFHKPTPLIDGMVPQISLKK